ncbi:MAG: hypothetical protein PHR00_00790 [Patescibacteria group bacterium]|nr:hypothetical protein [Patescibacteria group bacterium]
MRLFFAFIIGLLLIMSLEAIAEQKIMFSSSTPIEAKKDASISILCLTKNRINLEGRFDKKQKMVKYVYEKKVPSKENPGWFSTVTCTTMVDENYVSINIRPVLRKMGMKLRSRKSNEFKIEKLEDEGGKINWLLFINGAPNVIWLPELVKKRGNKKISAEATLLEMPNSISLDSLEIKRNEIGLTYIQGSYKFFTTNSGSIKKDISTSSGEIAYVADTLFGRKIWRLMIDSTEDWLIEHKTSVKKLGRFLGTLSTKDSSWQNNLIWPPGKDKGFCFFDGRFFNIVWPNSRLSEYFVGNLVDEDLFIICEGQKIGKSPLVLMYQDSIERAIIWLRSNYVLSPTDRFIYSRDSSNGVHVDFESKKISFVDSGNFSPINLNPKKIKDIGVKKLSEISELPSLELKTIAFEADEEVVLVDYEETKGKVTKKMVWVDRRLITEYYGLPIFSGKDSVFVFKKNDKVVVPSKDLSKKTVYYIPGNKTEISAEVKLIDKCFKVLQIGYDVYGEQKYDWVWFDKQDEKNENITIGLGEYMGRVKLDFGTAAGKKDLDTSLMIFVNWKYVSIFSFDKFKHSQYFLEDLVSDSLLNKLEEVEDKNLSDFRIRIGTYSRTKVDKKKCFFEIAYIKKEDFIFYNRFDLDDKSFINFLSYFY